MSFFRLLRITVLLAILVIVAGGQWLTHSRVNSWQKPIWMTIYPVIADSKANVRPYVDSLGVESFRDIGEFLTRQGRRHGKALQTPLMLQMAPPVEVMPPPVPPNVNRLAVALWSLKMRWWTWRRDREDGLPGADVQMFVLYRSNDDPRVNERSVGIRKGMYGIVNASASRGMAPANRIIITHELLHVLGASDKYDLLSGRLHIPDGLADPGRNPLYPQEKAEIMGGRIAVSLHRVATPRSLAACVIGQKTAREIGWE